MRPLPSRIRFLRPLRPPSRPFTSRPQVPFLHRHRNRALLTTETKQWIKDEVKLAGKWLFGLYTATFCVVLISFGVTLEKFQRKYPSPEEWTWYTRYRWTVARVEEEKAFVDYVGTFVHYLNVLKRLEDPNLDGANIMLNDISAKSEPWRRGYYQALMGAAKCAEYADSMVLYPPTKTVFPKNVVIGPSNPRPHPITPGSPPAPKEEDVVPFEPDNPPEKFYTRILTTQGFTEKQRVDAAVAFATWLDIKGTPEAAMETYKWALDIASANPTGIINTEIPPTANALTASTSLALHHARNSNLQTALPIFLSVLRARRLLPNAPPASPQSQQQNQGLWNASTSLLQSYLIPPPYPSPPSDGTSPPVRDAKERCEEAAIMTYVGEILYASNPSKTSREDGLAWTREAVDIAEGELRAKNVDSKAKETCKQCLEVGLQNWLTMIGKMAAEEKKAPAVKVGGWLGFGGEQPKDAVGRWESEEQVIKERFRRVKDLFEEPERSGPGWDLAG